MHIHDFCQNLCLVAPLLLLFSMLFSMFSNVGSRICFHVVAFIAICLFNRVSFIFFEVISLIFSPSKHFLASSLPSSVSTHTVCLPAPSLYTSYPHCFFCYGCIYAFSSFVEPTSQSIIKIHGHPISLYFPRG